jgi:hypothetical protein
VINEILNFSGLAVATAAVDCAGGSHDKIEPLACCSKPRSCINGCCRCLVDGTPRTWPIGLRPRRLANGV